jgi:primosomal protein N' (replication factor Y) (superfamily II helicase)
VPILLQVWLPLPVPPLDYLPPHTDPPADDPCGSRVAVPWQGGVLVGLVASVREARPAETLDARPAVAWVAGEERVGPAGLALLAAQAARAGVPIGVSVGHWAAGLLKGPWSHRVRLRPTIPPELLGPEGAPLADGAWHPASVVAPTPLDEWRRHDLVLEAVEGPSHLVRRLVPLLGVEAAPLAGAPRAPQRTALAWLTEQGSAESAAALARDADVPLSAVRALITKGYAGYVELAPDPLPTPWVAANPQPPFDQPPALAPAAAPGNLLVCGGDAAARYAASLGWLAAAVNAGGQALWLVPEQGHAEALARASATLLPTLRLDPELAPGARAALVHELHQGTPALIIGTYPVMLMAMPRLARVAMWDAASGSGKQLSGARSVLRRDLISYAQAAGVPWLLSDPLATAELRALPYDARLDLPRRPPRAALLNLREEPGWPLAAGLVRLLRQVAERRRQALVISARRGYAAALGCRGCGEVVMCRDCDLPLRWHARLGRLRCHQCGAEQGLPSGCSACGTSDFDPRPGAGTEWLAEAVRGVLPGTAVYSWDRDQRDDLSPLLAGEPGVVVGTIALLRAPVLPQLALIALAAGDSLHDHEDIRAEEASLRTLLMLPDLAPRDRRPLLLAQVHRPEHPVWLAWTDAHLDLAVEAFGQRVSERRVALGYPPARAWARVQLTHRDQRRVSAAAHELGEQLRLAGADVLGPAPAPLARAQGRYAYHLFLRAEDEGSLGGWVARVPLRPGGGVVVRVDVDPYDIEVWIP